MRELPILVQQTKDQNAQRTFWLLDIELKASGDYPAETLYVSSQAVEYNGHYYDPRLRGKPQVKNTLGSATDGGSTQIDNTDLEIGQKILPKERFVEGSSVVMYFAWKLADGTVYADKVFDGEISGANLSMASGAVTLSLVGDLYVSNRIVGAFPLAQRCVHKFNVNGLLSPEDSPCGWQTAQGGNPTFCDKTEDGNDGCIAHGNLHRIGAIPFFANVTVQLTTSETSTGFLVIQTCFINQSPILLPNWSEMPLGEFVEGSPIMSFNEKTGRLEADEVEQVHIHQAEPRRILTIEFADRIIEGVTPEHPTFLKAGLFTPVGDLIESNFVPSIVGSTFENYSWEKTRILKISERIESVEVRNLSVRKNKTFVVARRGFHNVKPAYTVNL